MRLHEVKNYLRRWYDFENQLILLKDNEKVMAITLMKGLQQLEDGELNLIHLHYNAMRTVDDRRDFKASRVSDMYLYEYKDKRIAIERKLGCLFDDINNQREEDINADKDKQ